MKTKNQKTPFTKGMAISKTGLKTIALAAIIEKTYHHWKS